MKTPDKSIEEVLAALRDTNAPLGLERRILDALEHHATANSQSHRRRAQPVWLATLTNSITRRPLAYSVALTTLVVFAFVVPALHRFNQTTTPLQKPLPPLASQLPTSSTVVTANTPIPSDGPRVRPGAKQNARPATFLLITDSIAQREMQTPSHPAPPLPLTEQEKLFLRVVHKGDPEELAMLNPEMRKRQAAESAEEVQQFFEPHTTGDHE